MSINTLKDFPDPKSFPWSFDQGRPTWEVACFFPPQGQWREHDYFSLDEHCEAGSRIELVDGVLELLPKPTERHHGILCYLIGKLDGHAKSNTLGKVLLFGVRVRVRPEPHLTYREPDLVFMREENYHRCHNEYWEGADLVIEIVSGSAEDRERDYEDKVKDYAEAGILEYWIVDPDERRIRVLSLDGKEYKIHHDFGPGSQAKSVLLPGFAVDVDEALRGGE